LPASERHPFDGVRRRIYPASRIFDGRSWFARRVKLVLGHVPPQLHPPRGPNVPLACHSYPDPAWFTALVMILPPVMIFRADNWQQGLVGYSVLYFAIVGLVLL
jgi:hypothetical protein